MAADAEDAFQKELIELFVQEAHEWLQQIHVALDELQQGPASDRHLKLAHTIKAGITNLGGSAATISLGDVERASFAALPFVEAVENPAAKISADDFIALCKRLGHIHTALTRATGVTFQAESAEAVEAPPLTIPTSDLLTALQQLQHRQSAPDAASRNLIQTVIAQIHGLLNNGVAQCDVTSMRAFLDRLAEADDAFCAAVQRQLPQVTEGIVRLKQEGDRPESSDHLRALQEQVTQLWTVAQQVNASHAMTFLMGLHSFLGIVAQRRVTIAAKKYDAVEARLRSLTLTIQGWAENGRAERAAIGGLLPGQA